MLGHSFGQPDAAMRRRIGRDVALVHRVAASKKHGVRHSCPVEMRSRWPPIRARVDVGFHYVAPLVDVVAEDARDVVSALGENLVIPRRSRKATLAGGDGRFPFQFLASIKVSLLFGKMDNYSWRVRAAFVIPPAGRCRGGQSSSHRLLHSGWQLSAATEKDRNRRQEEKPNELDRFHEARKVCSEFKALDGDSPLDFGPICEPSLRNQIQTYEKYSTHSRNRIPMRTFSAMGTCDFCFDNKVHFRCDFCCNDPLKIRANQVQCARSEERRVGKE